jgi:hypothetical protein
MDSKRAVADEGVICIRANARCTNNKIGVHVGRYLRNELSSDQKVAFERHMFECIACDSTVLNWRNLEFALARMRHAKGFETPRIQGSQAK